MQLKNKMFNIIHFEEIDSTNTYAKNNIDILNNYDVITADYQTNGRGRKDHQWISSAKTNLMATLVIKDKIEPTLIHQLTQVTAMSIVTLCKQYNIDAKIKWPNDIYVNDKKLAGILIETIFNPTLKGIVIGTGINVIETSVDTATSLHANGCNLSIDQVLKQYLSCFEYYKNLFIQGQYQNILEMANDVSYLKNKKVILPNNNEVIIGKLLIDGRIELIKDGKIEYIYANEFSLSK